MNSISNISIFPEINSTSIWQTLVDNVLNGIAYLFAAILSTRARKIETAPVGVLQNTSAIETVLDIYGNAILRLAYSYLHNMSDAEDILQDTLIKYMQSSPAFLTESHKKVWLLHVAANLSKNKIDYNKIRETDELEETLVAGEPVSLCTAFPVEKNAFPETVQIQPFSETPRHACAVAIADTTESVAAPHVLYLRPKSLVLGVGCKKQIPPAHLEQCFRTFLQEHHLSLSAVEKLATIGLKREEPAILALCEKYRLPLEIVADADIQACAYPFAASAFVQQVTGLPSVSEASAYLASGCGEVLTGKVKYSGVTFAACRKTIEPLHWKERGQ